MRNETNTWHLMEQEDVLHELSTDIYQGLTSKEAAARRRRNGPNLIWQVRHSSIRNILTEALLDPSTLLLILAAAAASFFGYGIEAGTLIAVLILSGLMRTLISARAGRIMEDMARERIPVATVLRDGKPCFLNATELVRGDVVLLQTGNTVPCDGRVVSPEDARVSERGITDNRMTVHKFATVIKADKNTEVPAEFRSNMLFAGSTIISGNLRMVATACGDSTLIVMKKGKIEIDPTGKLKLLDKLRARSRTVRLIMLACVVVLTALSVFVNRNAALPDVFLGAMAMAVAAMSEFLAAIGMIVIAVTIRNAASPEENGDRAVIRQPSELEKLAAPDIMVFCGADVFQTGSSTFLGWRYDGQSLKADDAPARHGLNEPDELVRLAAAALAEPTQGVTAGEEPNRVRSFMSERERSAIDAWLQRSSKMPDDCYTVVDHKADADGMDVSIIRKNGDLWVVCCGPVDTILRLCTTEADEKTALTDETRLKVFNECAAFEIEGGEVLGISVKPSLYPYLTRLPVMIRQMSFAGYLAMMKEPERSAEQAVEEMRRDGVKPVVLTRNPDEDYYYLRRIGLLDKQTKRMRAEEVTEDTAGGLDGHGLVVSLGDKSILESNVSAVRVMRLFHRPEDERPAAVKTPVTAVGRDATEAGVLAFSDCGYAVSDSAYRAIPEQLAAQAAAAVYPSETRTKEHHGGLSGIWQTVRSARQAIGNLRAAEGYLLAAQTARLILILAAIFFGIPLINPSFIMIWGLLFDFIAVVVMAFRKPDGTCRKTDPILSRRDILKSVAAGLVWGALMAGLIPAVQALCVRSNCYLSETMLRSILSASAIFSALVATAEAGRDKTIFSRHHVTSMQALWILATVVFGLLIFLTSRGAKLIGGAACGAIGFLALLPAAVVLAVAELWRICSRRKP